MEALNKAIFNHDKEMEVTHKVNTIELDNWINHLNYISKELQNLIELCGKDISLKIDNKTVLKKLRKKKSENETLLSALNKYMNSRDKIIECEDTQCDMVFITEHESYRRSYLYHLDKYRRLKDEFFSDLQSMFASMMRIY